MVRGCPAWTETVVGIWMLTFAASFLLSIVAGIIQGVRGKELHQSPLVPLIALLHFAWVVTLTLAILTYPFSALFPVLRCFRF